MDTIRKYTFAGFALTSLLVLSFFASQIWAAEDPSPTQQADITQKERRVTREQLKPTIQAKREDTLKTRADREIGNRVNTLNGLITKINGLKRVTDIQKNGIVNQIQKEIDTLQALQKKIDAETDITALKTDVKSIVDSYRVYALFIPKMHILVAADRLTDIANDLLNLAKKLELRIADAKLAGKDVSALNTTVADMQSKIADANKKAQDAVNTVMPLMPEGYPGNKTQLTAGLDTIKSGEADLKAANTDAKSIRQMLKALGKIAAPTAAPSPSPLPTK